jgi:hypothetical protein
MNLRFRCVLLAWAGASLLVVTGCDSVTIPERPTGTSDKKSKPTSQKSSKGPGPTKKQTGGEKNKTKPSDTTAENQVVLGTAFSGERAFDFGVVKVGRVREMPIRVRNTRVLGTDRSVQPISVTTTTSHPANHPDFTLAADDCKEVLHPGDSCLLKVAFEPTDSGTRSGSLAISGRQFDLTGKGTTS